MSIDTVGELIEALENLDSETPVKLALQPHYPMSGSIRNLCIEHKGEEEGDVLWIACSDNEDYGVNEDVWNDSEIYNEDEHDEFDDDECNDNEDLAEDSFGDE